MFRTLRYSFSKWFYNAARIKNSNMSETVFDSDTFFINYREAHSESDKRNIIQQYVEKHFTESNNQTQISDFPAGCEWINTVKPLSLHNELKGKFVLLDFFTYCCINCMHVLPDLKVLESKYPVEQGLVVVGVHCAKFPNEKGTGNIALAVQRHNITHPVMNDPDGVLWNSLEVNCWPTLMLIGPTEKVILTLQGEGHLELLDTFVEICLSYAKKIGQLSEHKVPVICMTDQVSKFGPLLFPCKIAYFDSENGNLLAVSDTGHHRILVLDVDGKVKHIIGGTEPGFEDGNFSSAKFDSPQGITFKNKDVLYVADTENHAIREVDLNTLNVKTVVGDGKQGSDRAGGNRFTEQRISSPWDLCFGRNTNVLFIAMAGLHQIWALYLSNDEQHVFKKGEYGVCKAIAGSGREENRNNLYPHAAAFAQPSGIAYSNERFSLFIADSESSSIREISLLDGKVCNVAGGNRNPSDLFAFGDQDGANYGVRFQHPLGIAWDENTKNLYVADTYNHKIKLIQTKRSNLCTTLPLKSKFSEPSGLCLVKNKLLIADTNNHCIKYYNFENATTTVFPITMTSVAKKEIINAERTVKIKKIGSKVNVNLEVLTDGNVTFTKNAPSFWSIEFVGDTPPNTNDELLRQDFNPVCEFSITIPEESSNDLQILIRGLIYICKNSVCTVEKVLFRLLIDFDEDANDEGLCSFTHNIK